MGIEKKKKIQFTEGRSLPTQCLCTFILYLFSIKEHENKQRKAITFKKYEYHSYKALIFTKYNKRWMNNAEIITAGLFETVFSHKKYNKLCTVYHKSCYIKLD